MANNYWRDRELKHIEQSIKNDEKLARRLRQLHLQAMEEIEAQIEAFYGRYADVEGISIREARRRARKLDVEKYARKAKRYVKLSQSNIPFIRWLSFRDKPNMEMRIYNFTMGVNRLELLKLNIELELFSLLSGEESFMLQELTKQAKAEFERQAGILGQTLNYNEKHIASIVNASFLTATWSDRLWTNQNALRAELDMLLQRGIVQGLNPRALARELRKVFNASISNSERLLRTELARVQADVFKDSAEQSGFDEYVYIAEPSACDKCKPLDDKVFKIKDMEIGINMYPMHPNCRCSTSNYMSREAFEKDLEARGL